MSTLKNSIQKNKHEITIIVILSLIFVIIGIFLRHKVVMIDSQILTGMRHIASEELTFIVKIITSLGSGIVLCSVTLFMLILMKNKKIGLVVLLNLVLVFTLNYMIKASFARERPLDFMIIQEIGYSFPSAHAMVSISYYGFLLYCIRKLSDNEKIKKISLVVLPTIVALIALSRVYLGVHYPSDIIMGLFLGYVFLRLFIAVFAKQMIKKTKVDNHL